MLHETGFILDVGYDSAVRADIEAHEALFGGRQHSGSAAAGRNRDIRF